MASVKTKVHIYVIGCPNVGKSSYISQVSRRFNLTPKTNIYLKTNYGPIQVTLEEVQLTDHTNIRAFNNSDGVIYIENEKRSIKDLYFLEKPIAACLNIDYKQEGSDNIKKTADFVRSSIGQKSSLFYLDSQTIYDPILFLLKHAIEPDIELIMS